METSSFHRTLRRLKTGRTSVPKIISLIALQFVTLASLGCHRPREVDFCLADGIDPTIGASGSSSALVAFLSDSPDQLPQAEVVALENPEERQLFPVGSRCGDVALDFMHDGSLSVTNDFDVIEIDLITGTERRFQSTVPVYDHASARAPTGQSIIAAATGEEITVISRDDAIWTQVVSTDRGTLDRQSLVRRQDGTLVLFFASQGALKSAVVSTGGLSNSSVLLQSGVSAWFAPAAAVDSSGQIAVAFITDGGEARLIWTTSGQAASTATSLAPDVVDVSIDAFGIGQAVIGTIRDPASEQRSFQMHWVAGEQASTVTVGAPSTFIQSYAVASSSTSAQVAFVDLDGIHMGSVQSNGSTSLTFVPLH